MILCFYNVSLLFYRLKLDTLTDKDSAIQLLDSDDDSDFAGMQSTNMIQLEKSNSSENNESDECISASQAFGNELSCSQPQPVTAQAIMEEDELNIEEYDSDWNLENGNTNAVIILVEYFIL